MTEEERQLAEQLYKRLISNHDWSFYKHCGADATPHECYRHARTVAGASSEQGVQMLREVFEMESVQAQEFAQGQERDVAAIEEWRSLSPEEKRARRDERPDD